MKAVCLKYVTPQVCDVNTVQTTQPLLLHVNKTRQFSTLDLTVALPSPGSYIACIRLEKNTMYVPMQTANSTEFSHFIIRVNQTYDFKLSVHPSILRAGLSSVTVAVTSHKVNDFKLSVHPSTHKAGLSTATVTVTSHKVNAFKLSVHSSTHKAGLNSATVAVTGHRVNQNSLLTVNILKTFGICPLIPTLPK